MTTRFHGPRNPTTKDFASVSDHARLPWRFFARFTTDVRLRG